MRYRWPENAVFTRVELEPEERDCPFCKRFMHLCDHRHHKIFTLTKPMHIVSKLAHCPDLGCPGHHKTFSPDAEMHLTMPWWLVGWDVFAWIGHRRFARHWSVTQIRSELLDSHEIVLSNDSIGRYAYRYQAMLAARQQDPSLLAEEYRDVEDLILSIDGLQPEKGHETLYVVRELRRKRVWFAESLLSSAAGEVRRLLVQARQWAERLDRPVRLWVSDKQGAFVTGIAEEFPGVDHRYCQNHFLRDLAKPVLEADSHAKVKMRKKVRGLRAIEREVLEDRPEDSTDGDTTDNPDVALDYCTAVRGILNDDQGGPLDPPGLRMAEALGEVRQSLQRNLDTKKGGVEKRLGRLAGCIDRGVSHVHAAQEEIRRHVETIHKVAATLDPTRGPSQQREASFQALQTLWEQQKDPIRRHMATVMDHFAPGLFVAGDDPGLPLDNLDLERWFRQPKGHERRIHGHRHAGVRIVLEGPTLVLALDAHVSHPAPFQPSELLPYADAPVPACQRAALRRRGIMRKARSRKARSLLLQELERQYLDSS